jgi:hypothetical protein
MNGEEEVLSGDLIEQGTVLKVVPTFDPAIYFVKAFWVNNAAIEGDEFTVTGATTVSLSYDYQVYSVTFNQPENGTIEVFLNKSLLDGDSDTFYGDQLEVAFYPDSDYELTAFTVNNQDRLNETADGYFESTITGNADIVATFDKKASINMPEENKFNVYINRNGDLIVEGAPAGSRVEVYNLLGRKLPASHLPKGVYVVKVNELMSKQVTF